MMEYSKQILKEMFDGRYVSPVLPYWSLDADPATQQLLAKGNGRISLSGVQPKYSVVVDDGRLRLTDEGERGTYILKPAPTAAFLLNRADCPANEYATMQLARQFYGIETAACALCWFGNGQPAYLTRRFDVKADGSKAAQEDFAQLAGLSRANGGEDYKYSVLSYEDCADLIRRHVKAYLVEILKFFRLVLFNYITLNDDAHLKNFSLIERQPGDYVLSPAYDLMNTTLHLTDPTVFALAKGLFREGTPIDDTHGITGRSFEEFGRRIGLPPVLVSREISRFARETPATEDLLRKCGLDDALVSNYILSYKYRKSTLLAK